METETKFKLLSCRNPELYKMTIDREGKTMKEIINELNAKIKALGIEEEEHFFSTAINENRDQPLPNGSRLACFAVTGTSEGYYTHIESISWQTNTVTFVALSKSWTRDNAFELAIAASILLGECI